MLTVLLLALCALGAALLLTRAEPEPEQPEATQQTCSCTAGSTRGADPACPHCGGRGVC